MDELYTKYIKMIEYFYSNYSGLRTKPGKAPFMALEEFRNFVTDYGLLDAFPSSEIPLCYNLSIMTQLDEIDSERCAEMYFVEFLESLSHVADLSDPEILEVPEEVIRANNPIPLWLKTEALLMKLSRNPMIPKKVSDTFKLPTASLFDKKGEILEED